MITPASDEPVGGQRPGGDDVDQHPDQREHVGVDAERHRGVDDGAQREHADGADGARECHWVHIRVVEPRANLNRDSLPKGGVAQPRGRRTIGSAVPFVSMPIHDLKDQIARLPEQPGVYLYANAGGGDHLRRQGPEPARPGPQLPRRLRHQPQDQRPARRDRQPRRHRHRLGGRGAGAREQPDQAAVAALQHPAARRQELPLPAADDRRGVSAGAGGARGGARRQLLRRPVPAGQARPPDDGADAQAVRHPLLQRGDHRRARPAVPRVRHQALPGAVRGGDLHARALRGGGGRHAPVPRRPQRRAGRPPASADGGCRGSTSASRRRRTLRDAMRTVQTLQRAAAEDGQLPSSAIATCSASRSAPSGAVVQVFLVRGGRVVERVEFAAEAGSDTSGESEAR